MKRLLRLLSKLYASFTFKRGYSKADVCRSQSTDKKYIRLKF